MSEIDHDDRPKDDIAATDQAAAQDAPAQEQQLPPAGLAPRRRLLRWWVLVVCLLLGLAAVSTAWLGGDALARALLARVLSAARVQAAEGSRISASLLGGRVVLEDARLFGHLDGIETTVYATTRSAVDIDLLGSLLAGELRIAELSATGVQADLRLLGALDRLLDLDEPAPDEPVATGEPIALPDVDSLLTWWERLAPLRRRLAQGGEAQPDTGPDLRQRLRSRADEAWQGANIYQPADEPAGWPRIVLARLDIEALTGTLGLVGGAFDLAPWSLRGRDLGQRDRQAQLRFEGHTQAAGTIAAEFRRQAKRGTVTASWHDVPLDLLNHPEIFGAALAAYGPRGLARLGLTGEWSGEQLEGVLRIELVDLQLQPARDAERSIRQAQAALDELRQLHAEVMGPELPLVLGLTAQISGSPAQPQLDLHLDLFREALVAATDRLLAQLRQQAGEVIREAGSQLREQGREALQDVQEGQAPQEVLRERGRDLQQDASEALRGLRR